jgi:hypothetical protein
MNYLDIREGQGPSYFIISLLFYYLFIILLSVYYFIICLYFKDEKKLLDVSLLMNFNYYFKINPLNCCFTFYSYHSIYSIIEETLFTDPNKLFLLNYLLNFNSKIIESSHTILNFIIFRSKRNER